MSSIDILIHKGQGAVYLVGSPEYHERLGRPVFSEDSSPDDWIRRPTVSDVMTPAVFCVRPETPAAKLVEKMLALKVRRLFVVDDGGVLTGVFRSFDVLRKLRWGPNGSGDFSV